MIATDRCLKLSLIFVGKARACPSKAPQWIAKGTIIKRVTETLCGLFNKRIKNGFYKKTLLKFETMHKTLSFCCNEKHFEAVAHSCLI